MQLRVVLSKYVFQSTPPRGRRLKAMVTPLQSGEISIHASTREATISSRFPRSTQIISIHASTREATLILPCRHAAK